MSGSFAEKSFMTLTLPAVARPSPHASADDLLAQADKARDTSDWVAAAVHYREVIAKRPDAIGLVRQLGHMLKEAGYHGEAEQAYLAYRDGEPADADIYLQLGHLNMRMQKETEALPWYRQALERAAPDSQIAADARRGIEHAENAPYLQQRRAVLKLTDAQRFEDAYEALVPLLDLPAARELFGIAGNVCKELYRFDEARAYYEKFRAFKGEDDPKSVFEVELQLGHLERLSARPLDAMIHYARALDLLPRSGRSDVRSDYLKHQVQAMLRAVTPVITIV